jgi:hypothetical protein
VVGDAGRRQNVKTTEIPDGKSRQGFLFRMKASGKRQNFVIWNIFV